MMYDAEGLPIVVVANGAAPVAEVPSTDTPAQMSDPPAEQKRVIVNFTKRDRSPVEVDFDPDLLTWEDQMQVMKLQERVEKGEITTGEMLEAATDLLCKVTGQDVRKLPGYVVKELMSELGSFSGEQSDAQKN